MTVNRYREREGVKPAEFHDTTTERGVKVGRPRKGFDANGLKACSRCKVKKSRDHYHVDRSMSTGYSSVCSECRAAKRRRVSTDAKKRWEILEYKYGVTEEWFGDKLAEQDYRCAICGERFAGTEYGQDALCVDHDHETNTLRGLLCRYCNIGLGKFKDSVANLDNAILYLEEYNHKE